VQCSAVLLRVDYYNEDECTEGSKELFNVGEKLGYTIYRYTDTHVTDVWKRPMKKNRLGRYLYIIALVFVCHTPNQHTSCDEY
jgi:hypothetical protein